MNTRENMIFLNLKYAIKDILCCIYATKGDLRNRMVLPWGCPGFSDGRPLFNYQVHVESESTELFDSWDPVCTDLCYVLTFSLGQHQQKKSRATCGVPDGFWCSPADLSKVWSAQGEFLCLVSNSIQKKMKFVATFRKQLKWSKLLWSLDHVKNGIYLFFFLFFFFHFIQQNNLEIVF